MICHPLGQPPPVPPVAHVATDSVQLQRIARSISVVAAVVRGQTCAPEQGTGVHAGFEAAGDDAALLAWLPRPCGCSLCQMAGSAGCPSELVRCLPTDASRPLQRTIGAAVPPLAVLWPALPSVQVEHIEGAGLATLRQQASLYSAGRTATCHGISAVAPRCRPQASTVALCCAGKAAEPASNELAPACLL